MGREVCSSVRNDLHGKYLGEIWGHIQNSLPLGGIRVIFGSHDTIPYFKVKIDLKIV
jgi:hypothetical protein